MYFVYVLLSLKDRKLYIGYSSDLRSRLLKHTVGKVPSTIWRRPLKLIYTEIYLTVLEARRREKFLKGGAGHEQLKINCHSL